MKVIAPAGIMTVLGLSYLADMLKRRDSDNVARNLYEGYGVPALKALTDGSSSVPTNTTLGLKLHGEKQLASKAAQLLLTATGDNRPPRGGVRPGITPFVRSFLGARRSFLKIKSRKKRPYKRRLRRLVRRYTNRNWSRIMKTFKKNLKAYKKSKKFYKKRASFQRYPRSFSIPKARPDPTAYTFYTPQY